MTKDALRKAKTIELLIELMYCGKSRIVPALTQYEPIPVDDICAELIARHEVSFGDDFERWFRWFQSENGPGTKEEKETLDVLKTFKDKTDPLFRRAAEQSGTD